jgi:hemoglobin
MTTPVPTLYDWLGGIDALNRLTARFYERVRDNAVLAPIFRHMGADHPQHVAAFLAEVLGGPAHYSAEHGGHPAMVQHHLNRHLSQAQRREWVALLLDTADELKMPDDPEFRSALVAISNGVRALRSSTPSPVRQSIQMLRCPSGAGARSRGRTRRERPWTNNSSFAVGTADLFARCL